MRLKLAGIYLSFAALWPLTGQTFEVATIKANNSMEPSIGMSFPPGRLKVRNYTLKNLIGECYRLMNSQIVGAGGWIDTLRYDIDATTEEKSDSARKSQMLKALLADRFQLKFHRETREFPVYSLGVAKNGPQFSLSKTDDQQPAGLRVRPNEFTGHKVSMQWFAAHLSGKLDRPVINNTNLVGDFDFSLHYTPDEEQPVDAAAPSSASLFTALQEQLGLKLESRKAPVDVFVIDHAEKPSEN